MSGVSLSPPPTRTAFVDPSTSTRRRSPRRPPVTRRSRAAARSRDRSRSSSSHSPPRRTRSRVRSTDSTRGDAESDCNVYLVPERASGVAAASNRHNQVTFMKLMGLVDDDDAVATTSGLAEDFPAIDEQLLLLQTALDHRLYAQCARRGHRDGFYTFDEFDVRVQVGTDATEPQQCQCLAHTVLFTGDLSEDKREDLKSLIRSPHMIRTLDEGNEFVIALLRRLIHLFGMNVRVSPARRGQGVSYVLLHKNRQYPFAGRPDFVMYKDDFGAQRILICTGEVQSTLDTDTQNSIYAIGTLLRDRSEEDTTPILCITLFKGKYCTLALARLKREERVPQAARTVSLKYFISPSPIDLRVDLKTFAIRLYTVLKEHYGC